MLLWLLVLPVLGLGARGDFSWNKTHFKHLSERLQYLFGNISQLAGKGRLGLYDVSTVVSREEWGAGAVGCSTPLTMPVEFLVTHHVPGLECHSRTICSQRLRELRAHHMHNNSWCDLAYKLSPTSCIGKGRNAPQGAGVVDNFLSAQSFRGTILSFLVGDDGRVYEGVGWGVQSVHTQGYNNISLGFAFFGTKEGHSPSPAALTAMERLISYAVQKGHLSPWYVQPFLVKGENCLAPLQKASPKKACPDIVSRSAWEARETHCPKMTLPAKYAIIIHTAQRTCNAFEECRLLVQTMQSFLMDRFNSCDIGYNFLVGQDGAIYEGVGWGVQGSHTPGYSDIALGIAFMGTFSGTPPNAAALEAAQTLIQCAVDKGYLTPNYLLMGQSDVITTLSPGKALYDIISTWPHFRQ